jgi:hypothetical protein
VAYLIAIAILCFVAFAVYHWIRSPVPKEDDEETYQPCGELYAGVKNTKFMRAYLWTFLIRRLLLCFFLAATGIGKLNII